MKREPSCANAASTPARRAAGSRPPCRSPGTAATTPVERRDDSRRRRTGPGRRASATGPSGRRTARPRRRWRRSPPTRSTAARAIRSGTRRGRASLTAGSSAWSARRRGPPPRVRSATPAHPGRRVAHPGERLARPGPAVSRRGIISPSAPMSSARPMRSRSADATRTSAAVGVAPTASSCAWRSASVAMPCSRSIISQSNPTRASDLGGHRRAECRERSVERLARLEAAAEVDEPRDRGRAVESVMPE